MEQINGVVPDGAKEEVVSVELHGRTTIPEAGQTVWLELPAAALKVLT